MRWPDLAGETGHIELNGFLDQAEQAGEAGCSELEKSLTGLIEQARRVEP